MTSCPPSVPTVRRACPEDAEALARITSHADVFSQLLQMPHGDAHQWRQRLADMFGPASSNLLLVAVENGVAIGSAGLHAVGASPRRRHAMGFGIHVHPDCHGRGVGSLLMQAICDYADRWLGLLRLELTVYADNLAAQRLYRRFGFVDEGLHRAYALRDGVLVDSLSMARLHPRPPVPA